MGKSNVMLDAGRSLLFRIQPYTTGHLASLAFIHQMPKLSFQQELLLTPKVVYRIYIASNPTGTEPLLGRKEFEQTMYLPMRMQSRSLGDLANDCFCATTVESGSVTQTSWPEKYLLSLALYGKRLPTLPQLIKLQVPWRQGLLLFGFPDTPSVPSSDKATTGVPMDSPPYCRWAEGTEELMMFYQDRSLHSQAFYLFRSASSFLKTKAEGAALLDQVDTYIMSLGRELELLGGHSTDLAILKSCTSEIIVRNAMRGDTLKGLVRIITGSCILSPSLKHEKPNSAEDLYMGQSHTRLDNAAARGRQRPGRRPALASDLGLRSHVGSAETPPRRVRSGVRTRSLGGDGRRWTSDPEKGEARGWCRARAPGSGSAQLIFNKTKSVEYTYCNDTVVIPCIVINVEAQSTSEIFVRWKFKGKDVYVYDGVANKSTISSEFPSARIAVSELLKGDASLKMAKSDATVGNYSCEVTELSREAETTIELKYRVVSWFTPNENILIVIFPILAILLYWGQFGITTLKYRSSRTNERIIILLVVGLFVTTIVVVAAILFIPGEYSIKNATGLGLIVVSTGALIILQYNVFRATFGMTSFAIFILTLQILGYVLSVVGMSLCVAACIPLHGPLLISGLGIIALSQLLGLVYMKFVASNQQTIQPPRKAVEEPLNAFKESKGMMNDE
ncbi:leukocyte surface antigen CD47 [Tupaia chinensis]|uniref:leukocyte surface antigen CD47 n=1 Tax=Tupaia chinensis TaxID=246437 RepID=UPI000FFCBEEF|nr:leukocyte surface antigen CD47 [Tupaia chinensis]